MSLQVSLAEMGPTPGLFLPCRQPQRDGLSRASTPGLEQQGSLLGGCGHWWGCGHLGSAAAEESLVDEICLMVC